MLIKIKDEQGKIVSNLDIDTKVDISFNHFQSHGEGDVATEKEMFPLISSIDLYSDTYISCMQAPLFINEFNMLRKYTTDPNLRKFCSRIINELKNLKQGNFVVFFGD